MECCCFQAKAVVAAVAAAAAAIRALGRCLHQAVASAGFRCALATIKVRTQHVVPNQSAQPQPVTVEGVAVALTMTTTCQPGCGCTLCT